MARFEDKTIWFIAMPSVYDREEACRSSAIIETCITCNGNEYVNCKLSGANGWSFRSCTFTDCTIEARTLYRCDFTGSLFTRLDLPGSVIECCSLEGVSFVDCLFPGAAFFGNNMRGSTNSGCRNVPRLTGCQNVGRTWLIGTTMYNCPTVETGYSVSRHGRPVGVELEFNDHPTAGITEWSKETKGQLHRDGSCGWEAVTCPMPKQVISPILTHLCKELKEVSVDEQCGVHVHVDARDLRWADMYKLLLLYSHVEVALYMLAGQNRQGNQYCAPVGKAYRKAIDSLDRKGMVLAVALGIGVYPRANKESRAHVRSHTPDKKGGSRYAGLNIMPWLAGRRIKAKDTTVEFRMHRNCKDAKRVIGWANLCRDIVDYAVHHSENDIGKLLNLSPLRALCNVSPEQTDYIMWRVQCWRKALPINGTALRKIRKVAREFGSYGAKAELARFGAFIDAANHNVDIEF